MSHGSKNLCYVGLLCFLVFRRTVSRVLWTLAFLLICEDPKTSRSANGARMRESTVACDASTSQQSAAQNTGRLRGIFLKRALRSNAERHSDSGALAYRCASFWQSGKALP